MTIARTSSGIGYKLDFPRWRESTEIVTDDVAPRVEPNTTDTGTGTDSPDNASAGVSEEEITKVTLEADRIATTYIGASLLPVAIGMSLWSLVMDKHASWYSWGIGTLTGFVYGFGFVLMCPQLFINHKLKSVAYLPWNFLIYKFLNTFIDGETDHESYQVLSRRL